MYRVRHTIASIKWHITLAAPSSPCPGRPGGVGDGREPGGPRSPAEATGAPSGEGARQGRPSLACDLAGQGRADLAAKQAGLRGVAGLFSRLEHVDLPGGAVLGAGRPRAPAGGGGGQGGAVLRRAGPGIRSALAVNRACKRTGRIWGDRYHARELATPREVRAALVYVLMNHKKHGLRDRGISTPAPRPPGSTASASPSRRRPTPRLPVSPAPGSPRWAGAAVA